MTNSLITCSYQFTARGGQTLSSLINRLNAVPVDLTVPSYFGLRYVVDTTSIVGNIVTRTLAFSMVPSADASATCSLNASSTGAQIEETTVTASGAGYVAPPVVTLSGGGTPLTKAVLRPVMKAAGAVIVKPGLGYHSGTTTATLTGGGLPKDGTQGTVSATFGGSGELTSVTVLTGGSEYTAPPQLVLVDTDPNPGAGAVVSMGLGVDFLDIIGRGGAGYSTAPTIAFTPTFKQRFPDGTDQRSSLASFMTQIFEQAINGEVTALVPQIHI